ncbi:MAG: hypothetical protein VX640_01950 [Pseudomonadota bacterium]|nr:hypothetical protein [Pseudomonadota bacterium]
MTLGPAAVTLIGFIVSIAAITGVFLLSRAAAALRRKESRFPSLG